jgi:hypothetical protein
MKTEKLLKKDIDWLWKAASDKVKECIFSVLDNCAVATDGYRAHVINKELLPDKINGITVSEGLGVFDNGESISRFFINPRFLYDAIGGFLNQPVVEIILVRNEKRKEIAIVVEADHSNNQAFIMCVEEK